MATRHLTRSLLACALALGMGVAAAQPAAPAGVDAGLDARGVHDALVAGGYSQITQIKRDDGMWKAEAVGADGRKRDVRIDAGTGRLYPEDGGTTLREADIQARLAEEGYTRVHDVKFDDGLWEAEAYDAAGVEYALYLDPETGAVVGRERD